MPTYYLQDQTVKNKGMFIKYIWVIYAAWFCVGLVYNLINGWQQVYSTLILPFIFLVWSLPNSQKFKKKNNFHITINEHAISWMLPLYNLHEEVEWNDVQWIMFDNNKIILYTQSSFSNVLQLGNNVTPKDAKQITEIILTLAKAKQIKLVDATGKTLLAA